MYNLISNKQQIKLEKIKYKNLVTFIRRTCLGNYLD